MSNTLWLGRRNAKSGSGANARTNVVDFELNNNTSGGLELTTTHGGGAVSWVYPQDKQEIDVLYSLPWNKNSESSGANPKSSYKAYGINNSLVADYTWSAVPDNTGGNIISYLDKSLFGKIGSDDTINVLYRNSAGKYDWSHASTYTNFTFKILNMRFWRVSLSNTAVEFNPTDKTVSFYYPNYYEMPLQDLPTELVYGGGTRLKHGQGMPLCIDLQQSGELKINFSLTAYNKTDLDGVQFSISKNDFNNTYQAVRGTHNGSNEKLLQNVSATENNEILIDANSGDEYWLNIVAGNNAGTSTANMRVIKINNLTMTLEST